MRVLCPFIPPFLIFSSRWVSNTFSIRGGKPLWVDPFDQNVQHIFIDDNIRQNDEDTIVHPKVGKNSSTLTTVPNLWMQFLAQFKALKFSFPLLIFLSTVEVIQFCSLSQDLRQP